MANADFYKPDSNSEEIRYILEKREKLEASSLGGRVAYRQ